MQQPPMINDAFRLPRKSEFRARNDITFDSVPFASWKIKMDAAVVIVSIVSPHLHTATHYAIIST